MRAAFYLRSSSTETNLSNQRNELAAAAAVRGWTVVGEYVDEGISGARRRDKRPGLDKALTDATKRRFDVLMSWSVDRMGRSLADLMNSMETLRAARVQLYLHKQAIDTSTPAGAAMFGMLGVFAEFERAVIRERILAGMNRARAEGKRVGAGSPPIPEDKKEHARKLIGEGMSIRKAADAAGISVGMVHKIKRESEWL